MVGVDAPISKQKLLTCKRGAANTVGTRYIVFFTTVNWAIKDNIKKEMEKFRRLFNQQFI